MNDTFSPHMSPVGVTTPQDIASPDIASQDIASQDIASQDIIKNSSTATFHADVIEPSNTTPVLVDFWAPWCGPCRQLGPALEKIVSEANGGVRLVKINIDENQELATKMGVRSIPAVFSFSGGQPVDGFMGALPESELREFIKKQLAASPSGNDQKAEDDLQAQIQKALVTAQKALEDNDIEQAMHIYGLVLEQMPEHPEALSALTQTFLKSGALEQAKQTLQLVPEADQDADYYRAAKTALTLAEEAQGLEGTSELLAKIELDPKDYQAHMDLAILHNAAGNNLQAAEALLEIIKRDRSWNDDAARNKLLEFFNAWGATSPATIAGRKLLSRTLFS